MKVSTYVIVALPHGREITPDEGDDEDRDQSERDEVQQSRLRRVHHEEADEGRDQAEGVS